MSHTIDYDGWSLAGNPDLSGTMTVAVGAQHGRVLVELPGELLRRWIAYANAIADLPSPPEVRPNMDQASGMCS